MSHDLFYLMKICDNMSKTLRNSLIVCIKSNRIALRVFVIGKLITKMTKEDTVPDRGVIRPLLYFLGSKHIAGTA